MDIIKQISKEKDFYISLHSHTIKSIGDSINKIDDYINKAKEYKYTALAVTNHGSMSDVFEFYSKCKKNNIKPIIGCEVYVCNNRLLKTAENKDYSHLVLIAKNNIGFKNLLAIHNDAQLNGFYYKPRTDIDFLKNHGEGIIALSACVGGEIPKKILNLIKEECNYDDIEKENKINEIYKLINEYKSIFDDFYLEIQPGNFSEQIITNEALVSLAKETNTKIVITNDIHYLNKEDYLAHNIHVCANRKTDSDSDKIIYPDTCYYMMTKKEMIEQFKDSSYNIKNSLDECFYNVVEIIESCEDLNIIPEKLYMPNFKAPANHTEDTYLSEICFNKLNEIKLLLKDPAEYTERLLYELDTISELNYSGYFLIVRDFIMYAKNNNIPTGPGRGSICGSLVAFLCGITVVDPIKYNLLFERFISIHRKGSVPDIDSDFGAIEREKMFEYVVNKYGKDKCALVSTFSERKAKAALKDTGRVHNIPREIYEHVASLIPTVYYFDNDDGESEKMTDLSIEESIEIVPELKTYADLYPDWFKSAIKLSNIPKATSIHAAGTLISPVSLNEYIPLTKPNSEKINATSLNLNDSETAGFIKFDFLSLATLTIMGKTFKDIGIKDFDYINNDYNDENVWNLISSKNTTCLFQISSPTYKQRMPRLNCRTIEELAAALALVRGPCIASGDDKKYIDILEGVAQIEKIHPLYDEVTKRTNGILLFQEQLMQICVNFGFTLEEGYNIMKASAKKNIDKLKSYEKEFMEKSKVLKVDEDIAKRIFKMIVDTGLYSFNESHAVAYAILCYTSAWLKTYYPIEYMKNALTNAYVRKEKVEEVVDECRRLGIGFLPIDINKSEWEFAIEDNKIRIGLCAIKSFGLIASEEVCTKRPFKSMNDFLERTEKSKCSKRSIIPSIFVGAFSEFYDSRLSAYLDYCELSKNEPVEEIYIQGSKEKLTVNDNNITLEEAILGSPLISDPINDFKSINIDEIPNNIKFEIKGLISSIKKIKDRNKKTMAFLNISTGDGTLECVLFSDKHETFKKLIKKSNICNFSLKRDNSNKYIINNIEAV